MCRILILCETYAMILTALQIKKHFIKNENIVDLILTDEVGNSKKIAENIKELNEFNHVYHIEIRDKYKGGNLLKKIWKFTYIYQSIEKAEKLFNIKSFMYDDFYFCNFDMIAHQIYRYILMTNRNINCHRYEEGYSSYTIVSDYKILSYLMKISGLIRNEKNLEKNVKDAYFYEPQLVMYKPEYPLIKIPAINNKDVDTVCLFNKVFGYTNEAEEYDRPYVIFEESFCVDNNDSIDDYSLFAEIIRIIGSDKVTIKMHPRNKKNRFGEWDVKVRNSGIPWDVIMLNRDFSNTVFITISSGSVLNSLLWNKGKSKIILLYKILPVRPRLCDEKYDAYVKSLITLSGNNSFYIPETLEELKAVLGVGNEKD